MCFPSLHIILDLILEIIQIVQKFSEIIFRKFVVNVPIVVEVFAGRR
jgi:hypothetical protein